MKRIKLEIIKELIISILIVICIVLIISALFYDEISIVKIIPESEEYQLSEEMQEDIEDGILEETKETVIVYSIDAADLKQYLKTKEYDQGKEFPFAKESTNTQTNTITESNNQIINNDNLENNNYYEDEGIK